MNSSSSNSGSSDSGDEEDEQDEKKRNESDIETNRWRSEFGEVVISTEFLRAAEKQLGTGVSSVFFINEDTGEVYLATYQVSNIRMAGLITAGGAVSMNTGTVYADVPSDLGIDYVAASYEGDFLSGGGSFTVSILSVGASVVTGGIWEGSQTMVGLDVSLLPVIFVGATSQCHLKGPAVEAAELYESLDNPSNSWTDQTISELYTMPDSRFVADGYHRD